MASSYFVVDHVTDPNKKDGLVESYQMIPAQYQMEDGSIINGLRRVNFVYWPSIPTPFLHEEYNEDLVFSTIYTPEIDDAEEDEEEEEAEEESEEGWEAEGEETHA